MPLTSPAIGSIEPDRDLLNIMFEWLSSYFDGASHQLYVGTPGQVGVTFPDARYARTDKKHESAIVFKDMPPAQPLNDHGGKGFEIRMVPQTRLERPGRIGGGHLVNVMLSLHFWISVKKQGEGESIRLADEVANKLHALLADPTARFDITLKGVLALQPQHPVSSSSPEYVKRLVTCSCSIRYNIPVAAG